ncbi:MAG: hypothetical protein QXP01_04725 [Candidatus Hadarchaeum sp.]
MALLPKKFIVMWGDDTYGPLFSLHDTHWATTGISRYTFYVSQVYWCLMLLLGLIYLWSKEDFIPRPYQELIILLLISALFFEFWEVQPRYRHYLTPILAIMAAAGLTVPHSIKLPGQVNAEA